MFPMDDRWKKSPLVMGAAIAVIVLLVVSFFWGGGTKNEGNRLLAGNLQEAVGFVAAEETVKLLGGTGKVAILLNAREESDLSGSPAGAFAAGFKKGLAKPSGVQMAGHLFGRGRFTQNQNVMLDYLSLGTLQAAREQFPDAKALVSFMGLPVLQLTEEAQWAKSSPPKLVVVQEAIQLRGMRERLFQTGVVHLVLWRKEKLPEEEAQGEPRQLFDRYYQVIAQ